MTVCRKDGEHTICNSHFMMRAFDSMCRPNFSRIELMGVDVLIPVLKVGP